MLLSLLLACHTVSLQPATSSSLVSQNQNDQTEQLWYPDADGDGYGDAAAKPFTASYSSGMVTNHGDCDDTLASVHPGAPEVCNNVDDDCNGLVDDNATDEQLWYQDADHDGFGNDSLSLTACTMASFGFVTVGSDCDDGSASIYPGAPEACNGLDDNCDGEVDNDPTVGTTVYYVDADGDGFGSNDPALSPVNACSRPDGYSTGHSDCDDTDPAINPRAPEVCNAVDDDCNGQVDDKPTDGTDYYMDYDGDGYGDVYTAVVNSCQDPDDGSITQGGDCDDGNPDIHPGAVEICDWADNDCDGTFDNATEDLPTLYTDADWDGYGDSNGPTTLGCVSMNPGYSDLPGDCNDADPFINPGVDADRDGWSVCVDADDYNDTIH